MRTLTSLAAATAIACLAQLPTAALAGGPTPDFNPEGLYHNAFTGPFGGTEWFQVIPIPGTDRYRMADIFSGGFNGTITSDGTVTLDGGIGGGSFSNDDDWIVTPNLGGSVFTFNSTRAPNTTPDFPLQLDSAAPANPLLTGNWSATAQQINPRTGAVVNRFTEPLTVSAFGNSFRFTDPGGLFFQGTFESPTLVGFRVVVSTPSDTRFRTFPGSGNNLSQNMLGVAHIIDINNFTADIFLQSRAPLGSQTQAAFRFVVTRTIPLAPGDLNGDSALDLTDLDLMDAQQGLTDQDDAYNIAADLNADGTIDALDRDALLDILGIIECPGDATGDNIVDLTDLNLVLANFGVSAGGDVTGDGNTDLADLNIVLANFGTDCR